MKERGILFSAPMVRALLAGTKTQTRRALKVQPWASCCIEEGMEGEPPFVYSALSGDGPGHDVHETRTPCRCPYGQPGDRLWVREAWRADSDHDDRPPRDIPEGSHVWYEADRGLSAIRGLSRMGRLRPGMFMPCWASRITLEITEVRVERLNSISEADCLGEGVLLDGGMYRVDDSVRLEFDTARDAYRALWEDINGPGSWEENPWVWVVVFRQVQQ